MSKQKSLTRWSGRIIAVAALLAGAAGQARADVSGQVWYDSSSAGYATIGNAPTGPGSGYSTFTSTAINYANGDNTIGSFLNSNGTVTTGLNSTVAGDTLSFSNDLSTGTYILLTGKIYLTAGTDTFTVTHDDGAELNVAGLGTIISSPNPTSATTGSYTATGVTAGLYSFTLAYGEVNGLPAVLNFSVNGSTVTGVPEPSTMMIAGLGAIGFIGYGVRRRKARTA